MFWEWSSLGLISIFAWVCSTIFHFRDYPLTEAGDYCSAFVVNLMNWYVLAARLLRPYPTAKLLCFLSCVCFIFQHCYFMLWTRFDYGYNMKLNIAVGLVTSIGWLNWWFRSGRKLSHGWKCLLFILLADASILLEILDFPPKYGFDAHALWHVSTIPLGLVWFSFATDDCRSLEVEGILKSFSKLE